MSDHTPPIAIHPAWRRAFPWLPACSRVGRVIVGDGVVLVTRADGTLEPVLAGGMPRPGAAYYPEHTGAPRRY